MAGFHNYVQPGMSVVGSDGQDIGTVTKRSPDGFVTTNPPGGEVTVLYDSIQNVLGNEIILAIPASRIGNQTGTSAKAR